jgi:hypothetical protein
MGGGGRSVPLTCYWAKKDRCAQETFMCKEYQCALTAYICRKYLSQGWMAGGGGEEMNRWSPDISLCSPKLYGNLEILQGYKIQARSIHNSLSLRRRDLIKKNNRFSFPNAKTMYFELIQYLQTMKEKRFTYKFQFSGGRVQHSIAISIGTFQGNLNYQGKWWLHYTKS